MAPGDFAYRYAAIVLGSDASCAPTAEERDKEIAALKKAIRMKLARDGSPETDDKATLPVDRASGKEQAP